MRKVKEIKVGDYLFDRRGNPTKVLGVYPQGLQEVYKISFGDGREALCSDEHIWNVHKRAWRNKDEFRNYTINDLLQEKLIDSNRSARFYIPCSSAVQYEQKNYVIDPYVIGVFLGDGCCLEPTLTISSETDEIPLKIAELLNCKINKRSDNNFSWDFFNMNNERIYTKTFFKDFISSMCQCSYDKSIPEIYKYGSIEQRIKLIQGLMDTDGCITKDKRNSHKSVAVCTFSSTSRQLINDVKEVLGSLGYVSTISTDNRKTKYTKGVAYELHINIPNEDKHKLFSLKRKKEIALSVKELKQHRNYDRTSIRKIEDLGYKEEMTCFYVDNDEHLFLMNDFIVTHNTRTVIGRIQHLLDMGEDPSKIVAFTFTNQAAEEMRKRLGDRCREMFIGTIHSYANLICSIGNIDTYNYITTERFDKIIEKALTVSYALYPAVQYLFVDEFQDTDSLQYRFIQKIPAVNRFYVGDERQFIYGFRGASDQFIRELATDDNFKKYNLVENYRNPPNIIRFAEDFLGSMNKISPPPIPTITKAGFLDECSFADAAEEITWTEDWTGWAILCRTNSEIESAQDYLTNKLKVPNVIVKRGDLDLDQMGHLLEENRVKIMTIHSAKGLEFPHVVVTGAKKFNEEERRISYVAATRAMQSLYWCPTIRTYRGKAKGRSHLAGDVFSKTSKKSIQF